MTAMETIFAMLKRIASEAAEFEEKPDPENWRAVVYPHECRAVRDVLPEMVETAALGALGALGSGVAGALARVETQCPGAFWLFAKGRLEAEEPLFAFQILSGLVVLSEAESDDPIAAIDNALEAALTPSTKTTEMLQ